MDVMKKSDLIEALEESFRISENMYDDNLTRMAKLHEQIEALKEMNTGISKRMKETAASIRKLKE